MSVHRKITVRDGVFFITLTCFNWLNLFQIADSYGAVYEWFDHLKISGHHIVGYVTMPNHLHCLVAFRNTRGKSINTIIGNGKRFMAYHIIDRLKEQHRYDVLSLLESGVSLTDCAKNKIHEVFIPSFDWKECWTEQFILQKLNYTHLNPCKGKWSLVENYWEYPHSSAKYYVTGEQGVYPVTHFGELRNIDLTIY